MNRCSRRIPSSVCKIDSGCELNGDYVPKTYDERRFGLIKTVRSGDFRR